MFWIFLVALRLCCLLSDNAWPGYDSPIAVPVPKAIGNPVLNIVDLGCFAIFFIILDFINNVSIREMHLYKDIANVTVVGLNEVVFNLLSIPISFSDSSSAPARNWLQIPCS